VAYLELPWTIAALLLTFDCMSPIESLFQNYAPEIAELARHVREFLVRSIPNGIEIPDVKAKIIGYGYGSGYKDLVCTLMISRQGIKIGFNRGSEFRDPSKLLTGSGKVHRYVEIGHTSDLKNAALDDLIVQGLAAWKARSKS
jgi:hypothetical protein